jgi:hypothetical protein
MNDVKVPIGSGSKDGLAADVTDRSAVDEVGA